MSRAKKILSMFEKEVDHYGPIVKGKVRYYDDNSNKGLVTADDDKLHYDFALPAKLMKHAKGLEGKNIKFKKFLDPDYRMAKIGKFSFK